MGTKKNVEPRPFHEVAFETLEKGKESEAYKWFDDIVNFSQDAVMAVAFLLTRCIVPEKERSRIVPALITASKKVGGGDDGEVDKAVAFALTHFHPGKKGLKEIKKLLSAEYLKTKEDSDEAGNLVGLFEKLGLEVPERPKKEEPKAPPVKKVAPKNAAKPKGKAQAKGGKKKPAPKKPLTK